MSMSLGLKFPDWSVLAQFCRSAVPGANRGETPLLQENSCNCRFNISFLASLRHFRYMSAFPNGNQFL